MKFTMLLMLLASILFLNFSEAQEKKGKKHRDYIPNEEVAKKIAEAIWLPIYGDEINKYKPFKVFLKDSTIWVVKGNFPEEYKYGGVPYIYIQKYDCKILKVYHTK
jgi:hypothetical protein